MRAVVMEIHKNYCIVMTDDGQFLKQRISAGSVEIGDEIIIEKTLASEQRSAILRGFAIAAAVVVVVSLGAFGGYRIFKLPRPGEAGT